MIIEQFSIETSSRYQYQENSRTEERLLAWVGSQPQNLGAGTDPPNQITTPSTIDTLELSQEAQASQMKMKEWKIPPKEEAKLRVLQLMLEKLTGKRIRFKVLDMIDEESRKTLEALRPVRVGPAVAQQAGWGLEYDYVESHFESESVQFASSGMVKTSDGREIHFSVNMQMQRSFASRQEFHLRAGDALRPIDPLVINLNTPATSLTPWKFEFDLDQDGKPENISFVNEGSGLLALDLNEDGRINDGGELFGPSTGNGFNELAQYDLDGNHWIDENDPIFDRLRIWTRNEAGEEHLLALGVAGVGAIYLGSEATPFTLKDVSNQAHGQVQRTGIFLRENGLPGIMQQIDLFA